MAQYSTAHLNTGWTNANNLVDDLTVQLVRPGDTSRLEAAEAKEQHGRLRRENNELQARHQTLMSEIP